MSMSMWYLIVFIVFVVLVGGGYMLYTSSIDKNTSTDETSTNETSTDETSTNDNISMLHQATRNPDYILFERFIAKNENALTPNSKIVLREIDNLIQVIMYLGTKEDHWISIEVRKMIPDVLLELIRFVNSHIDLEHLLELEKDRVMSCMNSDQLDEFCNVSHDVADYVFDKINEFVSKLNTIPDYKQQTIDLLTKANNHYGNPMFNQYLIKTETIDNLINIWNSEKENLTDFENELGGFKRYPRLSNNDNAKGVYIIQLFAHKLGFDITNNNVFSIIDQFIDFILIDFMKSIDANSAFCRYLNDATNGLNLENIDSIRDAAYDLIFITCKAQLWNKNFESHTKCVEENASADLKATIISLMQQVESNMKTMQKKQTNYFGFYENLNRVDQVYPVLGEMINPTQDDPTDYMYDYDRLQYSDSESDYNSNDEVMTVVDEVRSPKRIKAYR